MAVQTDIDAPSVAKYGMPAAHLLPNAALPRRVSAFAWQLTGADRKLKSISALTCFGMTIQHPVPSPLGITRRSDARR